MKALRAISEIEWTCGYCSVWGTMKSRLDEPTIGKTRFKLRLSSLLSTPTSLRSPSDAAHHLRKHSRDPMQSQSASSVFKFSQDIERLIFEQAAFRDIGTALNLVLVSKAVREWCVNRCMSSGLQAADALIYACNDRVLPALYTDVNITRSVCLFQSYVLYASNTNFHVVLRTNTSYI